MKMRTLLVAFLFFVPAYAEDKMEEAIKNIDPDAVHRLLIPGYIMRSEDKKRYVAMAREVTNKTYNKLNDISFGDFFRLIKFSVKSGLALAGLTGLYLYHTKRVEITVKPDLLDVFGEYFSKESKDVINKYSLYSLLGASTLYLVDQSWREFSAIRNSESRMEEHRNALINEAVLQRLPVCEAGTSESILL